MLFCFHRGLSQSFSTEKPYAYWWWMGSAVDERGLEAYIDSLHQAGIGGATVIPIYGLNGDTNQVPYLSERWMQLFKHSVNYGRSKNFFIDLTLGTGWPYGGPRIPEHLRAKRLWYKIALGSYPTLAPNETLIAKYTSLDSANFRLSNKEPLENELGLVVYHTPTYQQVKRAGLGGQGYVLDYFSKEAADYYLQRFDSAFSAHQIEGVRAIYMDSYEVFAANYSDSLLKVFQQLHGYDPLPDLWMLVVRTLSVEKNQLWAKYRETASHMLRAGFGKAFQQWAHNRGMQFRIQAHGAPINIPDFYAMADIPETEAFGNKPENIKYLKIDPDYPADNFGLPDRLCMKLASSAAHLTGKKLVASETGTWLSDHFKESFAALKPRVDELFCAGVNHIGLHGFTYQPIGEPFPGRRFYASSHFGPNGQLYPDLQDFSNYVTQVQQVLQNSAADHEVMILHLPRQNPADEGGALLRMQDVHFPKGWLYKKASAQWAKSLDSLGYGYDFLSEAILDSLLDHAERQKSIPHKVLLIPSVLGLKPEMLIKIEQLVAQYGLVLIDASTKEYAEAEELLKPYLGKGEELQRWGLEYIRKKSNTGTLYFISNKDTLFTEGVVKLKAKAAFYSITYPATGEQQIVVADTSEMGYSKITIRLGNGESCLIRPSLFGPVAVVKAERKRRKRAFSYSFRNWKITYPFEGKFRKIPSDGVFPDPYQLNPTAMEHFKGVIIYRTEFKVNNKQDLRLALGEVLQTADVYLNGVPVVNLWAYPYECLLPSEDLKNGWNTLEIRVRTNGFNAIRKVEQQNPEWKNFQDINFVDIKYQPYNKAKAPYQPQGLMGPVSIRPAAEVE